MGADAKPVIGICSYAQEAAWGAWRLPAALVPLSYVSSVQAAGGRPLVVPPQDDAVDETLDALDGLILSGGVDIDPAVYGAERDERTDPAHPHRDEAELALLRGALARELPVLAICRGMQLLNVLRGGTLVQHVPDETGHDGHRETVGVFSAHDVRLDPESRTGRVLGAEAPVWSHHHQGVERVGKGLDVVGWAEDGSIEAIEDPERSFLIGVLWHPEEGEDKRLFEALVAAAREYNAGRGS
jgi:gamma-glutamyl-gamma-aminobutyrate hydrolase PuuD